MNELEVKFLFKENHISCGKNKITLYCFLYNNKDKSDEITMSVETMAELLSISVGNIEKSLRFLQRDSLVVISKHGSYKYHLPTTYKIMEIGEQLMQQPTYQQTQNILINMNKEEIRKYVDSLELVQEGKNLLLTWAYGLIDSPIAGKAVPNLSVYTVEQCVNELLIYGNVENWNLNAYIQRLRLCAERLYKSLIFTDEREKLNSFNPDGTRKPAGNFVTFK